MSQETDYKKCWDTLEDSLNEWLSKSDMILAKKGMDRQTLIIVLGAMSFIKVGKTKNTSEE